jgi:hypothetical protein
MLGRIKAAEAEVMSQLEGAASRQRYSLMSLKGNITTVRRRIAAQLEVSR